MKLFGGKSGLAPVVLVAAFAAILSGCSRVNPEQALERYKQGLVYEVKDKNLEGAAKAYADAAGGSIPEAAQAQANAARIQTALARHQHAVDAYRQLAGRFPTATVNVAPPKSIAPDGKSTLPLENRAIKDWVGTAQTQVKGGAWYEAEQALDAVNKKKPEYKFMDFLVKLTGSNPAYSYALAILVFTAIVKVLLTPLTVAQYKQMMRMQRVQPLMKELQEKYKEKPEEMNRAVFALYREQGVNPLGCGLSLIVQFPVLIFLYRVIQEYTAQFRDAWFLWINPTTHKAAPGIVGANLASPDWPLLLLYAASMYVTQKMTTMPTADAATRQQQQMLAIMMPAMFLLVLKDFPSAFLLYWFLFNVLSTWQTRHLMKKHANDVPLTVAAAVPEPVASVGPARTPKKRRKR